MATKALKGIRSRRGLTQEQDRIAEAGVDYRLKGMVRKVENVVIVAAFQSSI